jgi:hypothetical protein
MDTCSSREAANVHCHAEPEELIRASSSQGRTSPPPWLQRGKRNHKKNTVGPVHLCHHLGYDEDHLRLAQCLAKMLIDHYSKHTVFLNKGSAARSNEYRGAEQCSINLQQLIYTHNLTVKAATRTRYKMVVQS